MSERFLSSIVVLLTACALVLYVLQRFVPSTRTRTLASLRESVTSFAVAGFIALIIVQFIARPYFIPSASMEQTLLINDVLVVEKPSFEFGRPHDDEIAVFHPPVDSPDDFIKRVIGSPGDRLQIHNGQLTRNGVPALEPFADPPRYELSIHDYGFYVDGAPLSATFANLPPRSAWTAPDRVPKGCYIMLGDNRNDSEDSHVWGCAQTGGRFFSGQRAGEPAYFVGRAIAIVFPPTRIHGL